MKSGNIGKYEFLTETDVIPRGADASLAAEQFEYSPLGKTFDKQVKAIKEQGKKQVAAIVGTKPLTTDWTTDRCF